MFYFVLIIGTGVFYYIINNIYFYIIVLGPDGEGGKEGPEVVWDGTFPCHGLAGDGMRQGKLPGVEKLPGGNNPGTRAMAVGRVAKDGGAQDGSEVDSDLVGAPRQDLDLEQADGGSAQPPLPHDAIVGNGLAPASGDHSHPLAANGMPADRGKDLALGVTRMSMHQGQVGLANVAYGKRLGQGELGRLVQGDRQAPRGVLVETMDNAWAQGRVREPVGESGIVVEQGVDEGATVNPGRGVDDHAWGLVDHEQMRILIQDPERNGLGKRRIAGGRRGQLGDGQAHARGDRAPRDMARQAIDQDAALADEALDMDTRDARDGGGEEGVEPLSGKLVCDPDLNLFGHGTCSLSTSPFPLPVPKIPCRSRFAKGGDLRTCPHGDSL